MAKKQRVFKLFCIYNNNKKGVNMKKMKEVIVKTSPNKFKVNIGMKWIEVIGEAQKYIRNIVWGTEYYITYNDNNKIEVISLSEEGTILNPPIKKKENILAPKFPVKEDSKNKYWEDKAIFDFEKHNQIRRMACLNTSVEFFKLLEPKIMNKSKIISLAEDFEKWIKDEVK